MIPRYTNPEIGNLWTEEHKFSTWLRVELTVAEVQADLGLIPKTAAQALKRKASFSIPRISEIEAEVRHDVVAFLTSVSENVGEAAKYLHFGMTSYDLLDTALGVVLKDASRVMVKELESSIKLLRQKALKYKLTPAVGRTHGIHAEPTTLGLKFLLWHQELLRQRTRMQAAAAEVAVGKISGAVGNFANLDPRVEAAVCRKLGIKPAPVSTQVIQRDRHAAYLAAIALLGSSLEKFAVEIRHLQRTEVREMEEGFAKGQKGSSAMPHKRNPVTCENISGLARVLRGNLQAALENVALWHERDISHSSVERIILPDSTILIVHMLRKFNDVLRQMIIYPENMRRNLDATGGLIFSGRLLLKLAAACGSREEAYRLVQRNAMAAWSGKGGFRELLASDVEVTRWLSEKEIADCFDLDYYLRNIEKIYKKCRL